MNSSKIKALIVLLFAVCLYEANGQGCEARFGFTMSNNSFQVAFYDSSQSAGQLNYFWEFGDGDDSHQQNPTHAYNSAGEYFVELHISRQTPNPCNTSITKRVCLRCVFPGDANSDGIVNNADVLYVGLSYGEIGPLRPDTSTNSNFVSPSVPWVHSNGPANHHNGVNIQHSDCDGNGIIDRDDVGVIRRNYNNPAHKGSGSECLDVNDIPLYFEIADSIPVGSAVSVTVKLGDSQIPAQDVYGIAFSVNYDSQLIQPGTASFDYGNSLLGTPAELISLDTVISDERIETAVSRINHSDQTVAGKIGTLHFVMEENLAQKTFLTDVLNLSFSDITLIKSDESTLAVCAFVDSAIVFEKLLPSEAGSIKENRISVYPNPVNDYLMVEFPGSEECEITVTNVLGKQIIRQNSAAEKATIDISLLPKGIYFLTLRNSEISKTFQFEIVR